MKLGLLGILCAVLAHGFILFFGGLLFGTGKEDEDKVQEVELLAAEELETKDEKKDEEQPTEHKDEVEAETEDVPDAAEVIRSLELAPSAEPALDAASLSAIEAALSGQLGSGDFADSVDFSSGGRIGATGKTGATDTELKEAFSLAEIDQAPRAVFQARPMYPAELRSKKLEGVVTVIFVVDASGKVTNPRVVKSTHPAFDRPALDAVKQWKFEPGVKSGKPVGSKMRVDIRLQPI